MDEAAASFPVDLHALEQTLDARFARDVPCWQRVQDIRQAPSTALQAQFMRVTAHQMQQFLFRPCFVLVHRGKKRAYALVLRD